jgi:coatomer protein complex subunit alpha (xenin)
MNVASEVGNDAWKQLAVEALRQGNHEVVEMAYQKTKEFEKLSFLYLITGNIEKLRKMMKISEMRGDVMSRFHNALFLGDAEERVRVFEACGQLSLAYLTAATHGLDDTASRLHALLDASHTPIPHVNRNASLLQPPTPIFHAENWPLLSTGKSALSDVNSGSSNIASAVMDDDNAGEDNANWGGDDDDLFDDEEGNEHKASKETAKKQEKESGAGWDEDDLDLSDDDEAPSPSKATQNKSTSVVPGVPATSTWVSESSLAADHIAAGSVDTALQLLNRQIAASNVNVLRPNAIATYLGACSYLPGLPLVPSTKTYLVREAAKSTKKGEAVAKPLPSLSLKLSSLLEVLKQSYRSFTSAKFVECRECLDNILHTIPLIVVSSKTESNDIKELLEVCREYITALRVKSALDETAAADVPRSLELVAYFTHCNLQPSHLMLALKTAMANAFKNKVIY